MLLIETIYGHDQFVVETLSPGFGEKLEAGMEICRALETTLEAHEFSGYTFIPKQAQRVGLVGTGEGIEKAPIMDGFWIVHDQDAMRKRVSHWPVNVEWRMTGKGVFLAFNATLSQSLVPLVNHLGGWHALWVFLMKIQRSGGAYERDRSRCQVVGGPVGETGCQA